MLGALISYGVQPGPRLFIEHPTVFWSVIIFFSFIGVYWVSFNTFDIHIMVIIAAIAIFCRLINFPLAPMLLGFILGGMMEDNLRRALAISDGELSFLWERPITATILTITVVILLTPLTKSILEARRNKLVKINDSAR